MSDKQTTEDELITMRLSEWLRHAEEIRRLRAALAEVETTKKLPPHEPTDEHLEGFDTTDIEFVYEHGVGLTIYAHRTAPWLSWDETKELAEWLNKMINAAP